MPAKEKCLYTQEPLNEREPKPGNISSSGDCPVCGSLVLFGWDEDSGGNICNDGTASCTNPECDYEWKADWLLEAEARWDAEWKAGEAARERKAKRERVQWELANARSRVREAEEAIGQNNRDIRYLNEALQNKTKRIAILEEELAKRKAVLVQLQGKKQ